MAGLAALWLEVLPLSAQTGAHNTLTAAEKKAGWRLLFDGLTLDGWKDPSTISPLIRCWKVEDGCIKTVPRPPVRMDLFSNENYRDFELEFDWRATPRANSGIKYLVQDSVIVEYGRYKDKAKRFEEAVGMALAERDRNPVRIGPATRGEQYVIGLEYQLTDAANPDALSDPRHAAGALYDMIAPSQRTARPAGEFNHSRLVVRGGRVEHWLNGVKVVDSPLDVSAVRDRILRRWEGVPAVGALLLKRPRKECPITLQHHNDEVWFRDLKIRTAN